MEVIILGVDPGATIGWCRLAIAFDRGIRAYHRACGDFRSEHAKTMLVKLMVDVDVVAIESVEGYAYGNARTKHLIASAKVEQDIATMARDTFEKRVERLSATHARRRVIGKGNASDTVIASTVPRLVTGWPTRSNPHQRDAAVIALAVGWDLVSGRARENSDQRIRETGQVSKASGER